MTTTVSVPDEASGLRCVVASGNAGKLRELQAMLDPLGISAHPQHQFGIEPPPEPHPTFLENALTKARHASRHAGMPAIADDSGLCVPALEGAPGVHSARFAQLAGRGEGDAANNRHLLERLASFEADAPARQACYVCVLVWLEHPDDPLPLVAQGLWYGRIGTAPRGDGGFGYDPYFYLPDLGCTAAELTAADKNRHSHRGLAMAALAAQLARRGPPDNA